LALAAIFNAHTSARSRAAQNKTNDRFVYQQDGEVKAAVGNCAGRDIHKRVSGPPLSNGCWNIYGIHAAVQHLSDRPHPLLIIRESRRPSRLRQPASTGPSPELRLGNPLHL
jgi:hypothetical protein